MNPFSRRGRPWSITLRLTVLYAASAFAILLVIAAVLYWGLSRSLRTEDGRFVLAKTQELREVAQRFPGRLDMLQNEIGFESAMPRLQGYYARVLAPNGRVEVETNHMTRLVPPAEFPPIGGSAPIEWRAPSGQTYLLYAAALLPAGARTVQVALEVSRDADVLDVQRAMLAALVLLGTLISAGAGLLVARRGLRPIGRITAAATAVSATQLDHRIGGAQWPAELSELARVFDGMLDRLSGSFTRLSRFSADLAHEIRTPLTNLRGEAEVALGRARSAEEYRRVLESALEEYDRLTGMIDQLLFLARADEGAAALSCQRLDLATELDAVCDYFTPLAADAGLNVTRTGTGPLWADPALFRRAVGNLLANAIAHTPAGGRIAIAAAPVADGVRICVIDTGIGIAPEHLPRIFDRFYRVDHAADLRRSGSGLGLALVRSIAELHGGTIEIESRPGLGTTATLLLPGEPAPHITAL